MGKRKTLEKFESGGKKFKINVQDNYFLKLNDDCLDLIFKQLQMKDQINLAFTCLFLERAFIIRSKVEYKKLHINILQNLPLLSARKFLEMAGPQIQNLYGQVLSKNLHHISEHVKLCCTKINVLTLCDTKLDTRSFKGLMRKMSMITDLRIYKLPITDNCVQSLKMLHNLKNLTLREIRRISGKFIKDIVNIETLSLRDSMWIKVEHFTELCESLTNLNSLDFRGCKYVLENPVYGKIHAYNQARSLNALKLSFGIADNIHSMIRFSELKQLYAEGRIDSDMFVCIYFRQKKVLENLGTDIDACPKLAVYKEEFKILKKIGINAWTYLNSDNYLRQMATRPNLEKVDLSNCFYFTANGLLEMIKSMRKLHILNVKGCFQLNDSFAKDVLNMMRTKRSERQHQRPLMICVFGSGITLRSISCSELESMTYLVKFVLDEGPKSPDDFDVLCTESDSDYDY